MFDTEHILTLFEVSNSCRQHVSHAWLVNFIYFLFFSQVLQAAVVCFPCFTLLCCSWHSICFSFMLMAINWLVAADFTFIICTYVYIQIVNKWFVNKICCLESLLVESFIWLHLLLTYIEVFVCLYVRLNKESTCLIHKKL